MTGDGRNDAAAGPVAAHVAATAARLLGATADAAGAAPEAAQARSLARRLDRLALDDLTALTAARAALAETAPTGSDPMRDYALGSLLDRAAAPPLAIAEACADVVDLAGSLELMVLQEHVADVRAARELAGGAARAAAQLVEANLTVTPDDDRLQRARRAASSL